MFHGKCISLFPLIKIKQSLLVVVDFSMCLCFVVVVVIVAFRVNLD